MKSLPLSKVIAAAAIASVAAFNVAHADPASTGAAVGAAQSAGAATAGVAPIAVQSPIVASTGSSVAAAVVGANVANAVQNSRYGLTDQVVGKADAVVANRIEAIENARVTIDDVER